MSKMHRWSLAALLVSGAVAFAAAAFAAPTHPRLVERPTPIDAPRTVRSSVMPLVRVPLRYELRAAQAAPIKALPLAPRAVPGRLLSALLPRALATLAAPLESDACGGPRSAVLLATLPTTPFTPLVCEREDSARGGGGRATALVPGHNKNALYGRAYWPHDFDAP